jgi:hypothetical protein
LRASSEDVGMARDIRDVSAHFAAIRYLDQWFVIEQPVRIGLLSGVREEQRRAIERAAPFFNVARNLPTKFDIGLRRQRYDPVIDAIETLSSVTPRAGAELVGEFAARLSASYGDKGTMSVASKILWLWYRDPIVIYDSRVRRALGATADDYSAYRLR